MSATEKHYTVEEVAKLWRWGRDRVIRAFEEEPGVLRWGHEGLKAQGRRARKRRYWTLSIPESVLTRVHMRFRVNGNEASVSKPRTHVHGDEPQIVDIEKLKTRIGHEKWSSMTELEREQAAMRERQRRE